MFLHLTLPAQAGARSAEVQPQGGDCAWPCYAYGLPHFGHAPSISACLEYRGQGNLPQLVQRKPHK